MNIKVVKFITGEEIVAEVIEKEQSVIIKNPLCFIITETGQTAIIPYCIFIEDNLEIMKDHILYMGKPRTEVSQTYSVKFGGIVLAGANSLPQNNRGFRQ